MTEAEWVACEDPTFVLDFLRGKASDRKLRLFACDCVRRVWQDIEGGHVPEAITLCERFAEGAIDEHSLAVARDRLGGRGGYNSAWAAYESLAAALEADAWESAERAKFAAGNFRWYLAQETDSDRVEASEAEGTKQLYRLRDIFGNPFRPVAFDPAWRTSDVTALATGIYADKAFDRMPILADALQDAGCDSDDLLTHLRGDGPHVKGCWALDMVLGKE